MAATSSPLTTSDLGTAAQLARQLRVDSIRASTSPRLRSSDVEHVGGRSPGGPRRPPPALRLGDARGRRKRPPDLLQGARVPVALLRLQGGGSRVRQRADERLPAPRIPPAGPPHPGAAVGRRRHRIAGTGPAGGVGVALDGKYLDRVPFRVWVLCGDSEMAEGLDVGSAGQGRPLRAFASRRDRRRQPTGPARADRTGLGRERLRAPRRGVWLARQAEPAPQGPLAPSLAPN